MLPLLIVSLALLLLSSLCFDAVAFTVTPSSPSVVRTRIASRCSRQTTLLKYSVFDEDDEDDDDEDDDDFIDTDSLGDWRTFRRNLALDSSLESTETSKPEATKTKSVSKENEELLKSQNKKLAEEYLTGVWAHETSTVSEVFCFWHSFEGDI